MDTFVVRVAEEGLKLVLILSGPPVITALCVGLFVSLLQATTQVQEQTLTFVPKLVSIILVVMFLGPYGFTLLVKFTDMLFRSFVQFF